MPRAERPLEQDGSVLSEFASDLRVLREKAGSPPYRELAQRAHYSSTTLSDAAGGRRLPSLAVTLAYVAACGGDRGEWERRWHAIATDLNEVDRAPDDHAAVDAPYVGLAAYSSSDAERFFGRERLVDDLLARLRQQHFLALFGPSGAGKSSVLRAGLVPNLRARNDAGPVVLFTPGPHPLQECALRLAPLLGTIASVVEAELTTEPRGLVTLSNQLLLGRPSSAETVIVVDQFEEIFTLCADRDERDAFMHLLLTAASAGSRCRIVLGVRADFYGHCAQHEGLVAALQDAQVTVGPMTADELRRAITRPATGVGCAVESDLLSVLIAHTHGQAGVLPLLSHALRETWRRRKGNTLTLAGFRTAGGLDGALVRTAEAVFGGLTAPQQRLAQHLLKRLVVMGEGTEDTKRRVRRSELDDADDTAAVLQVLGDARLLTLDRDTIEITHEALIGAWPRLRRWLDADREGHRLHRELGDGATTWETHGRDPATLLRGNRLTLIADFARRSDELTVREREFLKASIAARDREQSADRRRIRRQRALIAILTVIVMLASAALAFAINSQRNATQQRNTALALRAAAAAIDLIPRDATLAAQIALSAYRLQPTQETMEALISASAMAHGIKFPSGGVDISDDARTLAVLNQPARTTTIYTVAEYGLDVKARIPAPVSGSQPPYLSPDGKLVAAIEGREGIVIWSLGDQVTPPAKRATIPRASYIADWSSDGRYLLAADGDYSEPGQPLHAAFRPAVWDLANLDSPALIAELTNSNGSFSGKFIGDSRTVAALQSKSPEAPDQGVDLISLDQPGSPRKPWLKSVKSGQVIELHILNRRQTAWTTQSLSGGQMELTSWSIENTGDPSELGKVAFPAEVVPRIETLTDRNPATVIATNGNLASIWDLADIQRPKRKLTVTTGGSRPADFRLAPDGQNLLGILGLSSEENILAHWEFDPNKAAAKMCGGAEKVLPPNVWDEYFSGLDYRSPC
ncbi:helix-turn-helix domain-containing protein [Amycolatopsis sp. DG1A-15b]|uniref:helix-turn-helix domain-containing protein n=1 Tax=Amycolatopsis sp. DG1A-15b TaxID=3052846 RepID=UPI00255B48C0|nr:helix-turn-helix domain-containing protein [Amycolatopsis sp. DG1A-15b]WIX92457.1 hypothetical protein QRY02_19265 [Amycolatopsis sp. DG1A-15b]